MPIALIYRHADNGAMDWKQLIAELMARGWTQVQIAASVGSHQSFISELATGKARRPSFDVGAGLKALQQSGACAPRRTQAQEAA